MSHFKQIIAFALVLSIILSFGVSVFAAGEAAEAEPVVTEETGAVDSGDTAEEGAKDIPEPEQTEEPPAEETAPVSEEEPADSEGETVDPAEAEEADSPEEIEEPEETEEPVEEEEPAEPRPWVKPGNTDAEILGGGRYLISGDTLYYSEGGIWVDSGRTTLLTADEGVNLNLADGYIYYTLASGDVRRIPAGGGTAETVYSFGAYIKQMYVMGTELRFVSGGAVYSYDMETEELRTVESPSGVMGLIPTVYGNIFLTGSVLNYTLWAEDELLRSGVEQAYTDGDWLVVYADGKTMQAALADTFDGAFALQTYDLHQNEMKGSGLSEEDQIAAEAAFLESDTYELMQDGLSCPADGAYTATNNNIASTAYTSSALTSDQKNIVMRARQMAEVLWTPLKWRYAWGGDNSTYVNNNRGGTVTSVSGTTNMGFFQGGETYQGIPYSQAVHTGYVGWSLTIDEFVEAVNDTSSKFYSGYSSYSRTAPYYGSDCSGFVSWAWDLPYRVTCSGILNFATKITSSLQNMKIGDCLNNPSSHVVLITNIGYDANGNVNAVEITEQTPCKMRVTCYGELFPGKTYDNTGSLSYLEKYYFNGGYGLYRRNYSGTVSFKESQAVSLTETGYAPAPIISIAINSAGTAKVVTLRHSNSNAVIYYTTDGTTPTKNSTRYTKPFEVTKDTTVKAIAVCGSPYTGSYALTYNVPVSKADKPYVSLVSGALSGSAVSSGSVITLTNGSTGDKIYYTTDGSAPTKNSTLMTSSGIKITAATTIKAIAVSDSNLNSDVVELKLTLGTFHNITASASAGGTITPSGVTGVLNGGSCTFKIAANDLFMLSDVLVDGKSVGKVTSYTFTNVTAPHTITAKFAVDLPFTDVSGTAWYAENVSYAYSHGLFSGTTTTTFTPNGKVTRGMFITVLGRFIGNGQWSDLESWSGVLGITNGTKISIRDTTTTDDVSVVKGLSGSAGQHVKVLAQVPAGLDGGTWYRVKLGSVEGYMRERMTGTNGKILLYVYSGAFTDLPPGAYYTGYAQWANIYDIMKGTSTTTFSPNNAITRQDICVMLYRYITNYTGKTLSTTKKTTFTDDSKISSYAKDAVYAMQNIGVINGRTDGSFGPKEFATRAEVAAIFQRLYEWMN